MQISLEECRKRYTEYMLSKHRKFSYILLKKNKFKYCLRSSYLYSHNLFSQLKESYAILDSKNHKILDINCAGLFIKKSFKWDGVTVAADKVCKIRASLIHDALYSLKREQKIPLSLIDIHKIFRDICIEDGTNKIEAYADFSLLCAFGWLFL